MTFILRNPSGYVGEHQV